VYIIVITSYIITCFS